MRRATTRPVLVLTLVPLHQFLIRNFTFVVPLQTEWFLAQNGRLETSPRLNLKVIEWPAMRAEPVGSTWGKVDERAGFDLFEVVFHFNHSTAAGGFGTIMWSSSRFEPGASNRADSDGPRSTPAPSSAS